MQTEVNEQWLRIQQHMDQIIHLKIVTLQRNDQLSHDGIQKQIRVEYDIIHEKLFFGV
jgi:hypothetical protein